MYTMYIDVETGGAAATALKGLGQIPMDNFKATRQEVCTPASPLVSLSSRARRSSLFLSAAGIATGVALWCRISGRSIASSRVRARTVTRELSHGAGGPQVIREVERAPKRRVDNAIASL